MSRIPIRALALIALLAANAAARSQNTAPPPCKPNDTAVQQGSKSSPQGAKPSDKGQATDAPCSSSGTEPSAADRFPFPGEPAPAPAKQQEQPNAPNAPTAPDTPAPDGKPPSAADKFPFPGSAPPMPGSAPDRPSGNSGSSSSSSSDDSDNPPDVDKPAADAKGDTPQPPARRRLPKVEKLQSDEERAEEDLKVAKFYEDADNLNAAYLRAKDAVKYMPTDPYTHFALAHVAQKMEKRDEAIAEYNQYLKLDPDGLKIKQAQKALDQLQH